LIAGLGDPTATIWRVRIEGDLASAPQLVYRPDLGSTGQDPSSVAWIELGAWSPDSGAVLFWDGPPSASVAVDGLPLHLLEVSTGEVSLLAEVALLNPGYQSWAPDGSAVAFTAGGDRSAQTGKSLALYVRGTGETRTLVPETEQVPGVVAWSPRGDVVAYAAVEAAQTSPEQADWMSLDNPAVAGRRVYLIDPRNGDRRRLNDIDAFQDAPTWSTDGDVLYYVQLAAGEMVLMAADPASGEAQPVPGASAPVPNPFGFYGQVDWDELLASRPE
jgi:Tol biopolymer transport system component